MITKQSKNGAGLSAPFCYLLYLPTTLCIAQQNLSIGANWSIASRYSVNILLARLCRGVQYLLLSYIHFSF
jgi:hypothetical protein